MLTNDKPNIPIDLHCHSTYSDGALEINELLTLVKNNGGKYIALTDHDTIDGISSSKILAKELDLILIPGVEISVTWDNSLIHILGLNINENDDNLINNLNLLRAKRYTRGEKIAERLAKIGIHNALDGALKYCKNKNSLSRTHFSRFLVDNGYVKAGKAFEKFLAPGKLAYVAEQWASLHDALSWIKNSGGTAVIAHPCRYKFTRTKLLKLISEFKLYGGTGIEVISSSHSLHDEQQIAHIASVANLLASSGNDFHTSIETYRTLKVGITKKLPDTCSPIFPTLNITDLY